LLASISNAQSRADFQWSESLPFKLNIAEKDIVLTMIAGNPIKALLDVRPFYGTEKFIAHVSMTPLLKGYEPRRHGLR
jgi:hypothetical protein